MEDPLAFPDEQGAEMSRPNLHAVYLQVALASWTMHFKDPGIIRDSTMKMLETRVVGKTLDRTTKSKEVRYVRFATLHVSETFTDFEDSQLLGADLKTWQELSACFDAAVPSLAHRCFPATSDPSSPDPEPASGVLIASHYSSLVKDIDRLYKLVSIARNMVIGEKAQNTAAEARFDHRICCLISVCVRVTARGYDGDTGTKDEERWQSVVNEFKKLLIASLQYLNNLIVQNERRKLMLWVELFDSSNEEVLSRSSGEHPGHRENGTKGPKDTNAPLAPSTLVLDASDERAQDIQVADDLQQASPAFLLFWGQCSPEITKDLQKEDIKVHPAKVMAECKKRWEAMPDEERTKWDNTHAESLAKYRDDEAKKVAGAGKTDLTLIRDMKGQVEKLRKRISSATQDVRKSQESATPEDAQSANARILIKVTDPMYQKSMGSEAVDSIPAGDEDYRVECTAEFGANILQQGKDDLMKRLETYPDRSAPRAGQTSPNTLAPLQRKPEDALSAPTNDDPAEPYQTEERSEELSSDSDSEDDDYDVAGDDGRGLLTDVPLILGPNEIEVLPMILLTGVVPPPLPSMPGYGTEPEEIIAIKNMHTVRCHLLLAQDNGKNLLRELLIFVAAWDLREEELYFKFMVKIMEAILVNALMPYSYNAFRE